MPVNDSVSVDRFIIDDLTIDYLLSRWQNGKKYLIMWTISPLKEHLISKLEMSKFSKRKEYQNINHKMAIIYFKAEQL